jgi:hypothetical protein
MGYFMSYGRGCAFSTLAVAAVLALPADGQSVVSTRSGVVHFFEGAVYLGDKPLEPHLGRFPSMAKGAELRTEQGRAEVLLTPAVFLRISERSAIRMLANDLTDTRVELLAGSAIVDSEEPSSGTSVTLIYRDWNVHFLKKGVYRIDSEPPRLWVRQGDAEVSAGVTGVRVSVKHGMGLPFAAVLVPERSVDEPFDALSNWADGRSQSISADNTIAASIQDPASINATNFALDSFTYFPMLGISPIGAGLSRPYSSLVPYQPGFNSIYFPGYTYRPLFLGLVPGGFRNPLHPLPRVGASPGVGAGVASPRSPSPIRPGPPPHLAPGRPAPHGGVHGGAGAHR